jgi:translation initiation factor 2B subunit (eIF-2B alpha/beta/delta family)
MSMENKESIDHPEHYGGKDNIYEAIKIIEAWDLNFSLGNVIKYVLRAYSKSKTLEDLQKARWYLNREIEREKERIGNKK